MTAKTFLIGFLVLLAVMLFLGLFFSHQFQPWLAAGMAAGNALAWGIRSKWKLSPNVGTVLVVVFIYVGSVIGHWLSTSA